MKQRLDPKVHGYKYVTRPGDDPGKVLHHLLYEAVKLTAELVSEGRSVDLGRIHTWDIPAYMAGPDAREIGWIIDSAVIEEDDES